MASTIEVHVLAGNTGQYFITFPSGGIEPVIVSAVSAVGRSGAADTANRANLARTIKGSIAGRTYIDTSVIETVVAVGAASAGVGGIASQTFS